MNDYNPAHGCTRCSLSLTRQNVVWGDGPTSARIMLLGEAPGRWEDVSGVPFVGRAGKLLDSILSSAQLQRQDVYVTNNVRCRPPENRDPFPRESEACQMWMDLELSLVQPRVIVTLGKIAARKFFPHEKKSIAGTARAITLSSGAVIVLATFHPAAGLRNPNLVSTIISDLRRAKRYSQL